MPRLPPAEKLSLAVRKNVRDNWEAKKADFEKQLSEKLGGVAWTVQVDPLTIFPYAREDFAQTNLGGCIASYVDGAVWRLGAYADKHGAAGVRELNAIAHAHVLTLDIDEAGANSYCGCAVVEGGKLAILFNATSLGYNANDALEEPKLLKALNAAPPPPPPSESDSAEGETLSFLARVGIRSDYDPKIGDVQKRIAAALQQPDIQLQPNFEQAFAKLAQEAKKASPGSYVDLDRWEQTLGRVVLEYFEGLAWRLDDQKFGQDDLLRDGFNEAVERGVVAFRIVDVLKYASYCEVVVEDGTLYVQTTPARYGVNTNDAAEKLIDQL